MCHGKVSTSNDSNTFHCRCHGCQAALGAAARAVTVIPEKCGLSGYVNLGVGGLELESNLLAKVARVIVDVGDATTDDIDSSRDNERAVFPMLIVEVHSTCRVRAPSSILATC